MNDLRELATPLENLLIQEFRSYQELYTLVRREFNLCLHLPVPDDVSNQVAGQVLDQAERLRKLNADRVSHTLKMQQALDVMVSSGVRLPVPEAETIERLERLLEGIEILASKVRELSHAKEALTGLSQPILGVLPELPSTAEEPDFVFPVGSPNQTAAARGWTGNGLSGLMAPIVMGMLDEPVTQQEEVKRKT